ncbi:MAG: class I SAM-dependent RNA methyltransferase [Anaerolineaceae bacterium]|nr:class I SAM-dependent RNA methyltransferase [Anaerolineaceae bacterium]
MPETILEVKLDKLVYGGDAMGRLEDGRAVFVPYALPGETARVRVVTEKRGHVRAELVEVLEASPERIAARCKHFTVCGGCHYQHMSYAKQLEVKRQVLVEQFQRMAGIDAPPVEAVVPSPAEWNYRNTVQFSQTEDGKLGFQAAGTRRVIPITECFLPEEDINQIWPQLNLEPVPGLQRIELRQADNGEMLVLSGQDELPPEMELELPISAVYLSPVKGPMIMAGDEFGIIHINERPFSFHAGSFFQVNTAQAEALVNHVMGLLPLTPETVALDVYCGVGLFSAFIAPQVKQLIGIEYSGLACEDFAVNLDEFENVAIYQGPAERILPSLEVQPDVVVMDPPRAGLKPEALDALVKMEAGTLVYVSCDPATLARDVKRLLSAGYRLERITPFDLFPQTYHIETVVLLTK